MGAPIAAASGIVDMLPPPPLPCVFWRGDVSSDSKTNIFIIKLNNTLSIFLLLFQICVPIFRARLDPTH
jgi:hypothetical protein